MRIESDIVYDAEIYEESLHYHKKEVSVAEKLMPIPESAMRMFLEELDNIGMSFYDKLFELSSQEGNGCGSVYCLET